MLSQVDQVTCAQFRNGLSSLGLELNSDEAELLNKRFMGQDVGMVDYVAFACAVDPAERTFSMREPRSWVAQPLASGFRKPRYLADGRAPMQPGRPAGSTEFTDTMINDRYMII